VFLQERQLPGDVFIETSGLETMISPFGKPMRFAVSLHRSSHSKRIADILSASARQRKNFQSDLPLKS
jgi:hypothetical protein